jgi:DNA-binding CsgD family transcriptional regulator
MPFAAPLGHAPREVCGGRRQAGLVVRPIGPSVRVVGRELELNAVDELLAAASDGLDCLALEGEPGIGKTTLWLEAVRRASDRSFCVLSSRPAASEARLSFAGLGDLFAGVAGEVVAALPVPQREALDAALLRVRPGRAPDQRTVGVALLSVVRSLAACSPVLIAVDDAQWLDGATAAVLEFAVRRFGSMPVKILVTVRVSALPVRTFDCAIHAGRRRVVLVGPLGAQALHDVIRAQLGYIFPYPVLFRLEQAARGNPFYAIEIGRELLARGELSPGERLPVPRDLRQLATARIRRLPAGTRQGLLLAAALTVPRMDLVAGADLSAAEEAGIIVVTSDGRIDFTHPLFSSAVYSAAPLRVRRQAHKCLAGLVEDPEERARHLALAADGPDESIALALEDAGEWARARGATAAAAELLEQASTLTPGNRTDDGLRREIKAAEHHYHAGDLVRARALLGRVLDRRPGARFRAKALYLLGQLSIHASTFTEAIALFTEALNEAGDDQPLRVPIELALAFAAAMSGDFPSQRDYSYAALRDAQSIGDRALLAQALAHVQISNFFAGDGVKEADLERVLKLEDLDRPVASTHRPSLIVGVMLIGTGQFERARRVDRDLYTWISERGEESSLPFLAGFLAWIECSRGDPASAARFAKEGLDASLHLGSETMQAWNRAFGALAAAIKGDVAHSRSEIEESLRLLHRTGWIWGLSYALAALGFLELSLGNPAGTAAALGDLTARVESQGLIDPFLFGLFLPDEIEALIALGDLERARSLIGLLDHRGRVLDRAWALAAAARCQGLLAAARGDLAAALESLEHALDQHERMSMPLELGRTLLVRGQLERRTRQKAKASRSLQEALAIFERVGARLWARRTSSELARLGLRRSAPGQLTVSERRVAELAASGLKNREVAAQLFISQKTVEANLARVYRKLEIGSRAELGARLAPTKISEQ